jgi:hypothetical protein
VRHSARSGRVLRGAANRLRERGLTLVEWLVGIVAVLMVAGLLIPAGIRAARQEKVLACKSHLRGLYQASAAAAKESVPLGKAYWIRLNSPGLLRCPLVANSAAARCDYLGPSADPAGLDAKVPIGCDEPDNHGEGGREGGNVLMKSGEVHTDAFQLWGAALQEGHCRP